MSKKIISPKDDDKDYDGKLYFATYDENKYPRDTINNGPEDSLSLFRNKWYSKHLKSMNEISLFDKRDKDLKIFRYTNLGTWSNPFVYKMENINDNIVLTYAQSDGLGGYQTGKIVKEYKKKISVENWNGIISKASDINFWNIGTHDPNIVLDGEEWILEILIGEKYHLVTRNSPENNNSKEFAELCNLLKN
ncbi:hypothetical protein NAL32_10160 [Chryseobacterium sp. Ch-15]|uniref:Uncharacterized protein n=1 Tax=Chryseobacterium muglaense TaxID=2893752 RepID=A0A9Q3USP3_9FLAO|nr:hypothetical protein [Chryseobacterium muglaense]MBD3904769.1 hypothetical protein [Chryseobacterium muglaense]MCC9033672.1 hypothetical protein [Chryseobacterium muglaense]MCM2554747.1 hypothetical protein [Chryseobacterium muglaense]